MKKIKPLLAIVALFAITLTFVACTTTAHAEESYVTIDINPSVELIVNGREEVVYVNALNEDAEVLLADLDLIGMQVDEATDLIIQTAIELGYIDIEATDTIVEVSSMSETALGEQIRERVKAAINNAFENRGLHGHSQDKGFTSETIADAETYGVTPGFLFLAQKVVDVQDDMTLEDALTLTQEALRDILKDARDEARDILYELRDEFHAARDLIHDEFDPQITALETSIADTKAAILDVETQIETESTPALVAQLETFNADLTTYEEQLQTLVDDMRAELQALRDEFHEQSEALMPEIRATRAQRREQFMNRLSAWLENHPDNPMAERVQEWRNNRQGNSGKVS